MKIQKFNERVSTEVENFLDILNGEVDHSILDWISSISRNTILKEYSNIFYDDDNIYTKTELNKKIKLANDKNFKYYKKYLETGIEINNLYNQAEKLKKQNEKLLNDVNSEVVYKFQEELIQKDINEFYIFFLKDLIEESSINNYEYEILNDIHPNIYKKYKNIINNIPEVKDWNLKKNSAKYNL